MSPDELLTRWDGFVENRSLPYYRDSHRLMMRQLLQRFPFGKLSDLSDHDLVDAVNEDSDRSMKLFLKHLDRFLVLHDMERTPD